MKDPELIAKAKEEERADGFLRAMQGITEYEWLDLDEGQSREKTLLESGQMLHHHPKSDCSGDCCLHGTSTYSSCKMPRRWNIDKQAIEHFCPHRIAHPCFAGVAYSLHVKGDLAARGGAHGCCGEACCLEGNAVFLDAPTAPSSPTATNQNENAVANAFHAVLNLVEEIQTNQHERNLAVKEDIRRVKEDIKQLTAADARHDWWVIGLVFTNILTLSGAIWALLN